MAFSFDKFLGPVDDSLLLRARRSEILASNLANEDTPGYQAKDIDFKVDEVRKPQKPAPNLPWGRGFAISLSA